MTTQEAAGVRNRMCAVFSEANGEDPCGSAPMWDHCLVIEIPTPWEHEVMDSPGFPDGVADILEQRPDVRLQVIQPDDTYSVDGHSRIMLFSRPDGPVRDMARREYLVPSDRLSGAVSAILGNGRVELAEWEQHNNGCGTSWMHARLTRHLLCVHRSAHISRTPVSILEFPYASVATIAYRRTPLGSERD